MSSIPYFEDHVRYFVQNRGKQTLLTLISAINPINLNQLVPELVRSLTCSHRLVLHILLFVEFFSDY